MMPPPRIIHPLAQQALLEMKMEIAQELGFFPKTSRKDQAKEFKNALERKKFQRAQELGIHLTRGYNGDLKSKEAGAIGGHLGGRIGGQMVKRMIQMAKEKMLNH